MANNNSKKKNRGATVTTDNTTTETIEDIGNDTPEADQDNSAANADATANDPETPSLPPEPPVDIASTNTVSGLSDEENTLMGLITTYKGTMEAANGFMIDEKHLLELIRIVKYAIRTNKEKLFHLMFDELFMADHKNVMAPQVVFQKLEALNDIDLPKAKILYATMDALKKHLAKPKNIGFPLDVKKIQDDFGGTALGPFLKSRLNI